jgi:signal transduction histidine kinase
MRGREAVASLRRWKGRRTVRLRLTVLFTGLFLLAGAGLVGVTYALVANSLGPEPVGPSDTQAALNPKLAKACKEARAVGAPTPDPGLVAECKQAFKTGVAVGANQKRAQALDHLLLYSVLALGCMTVVSAMLGWFVAGRILHRLHTITAAARRASERNLNERLALQGPADELKELADTFDAMLARLDAAFASQRHFVTNASHELRTPLTVMRTAIDVTLAKENRTPEQLEEMAAEVRQAVVRAEALIEALLTLARSDRAAPTQDFVDLATAAEDALDLADPAIRRGGLYVHTTLAPAETIGDQILLERMVANLVDNATRHNVPGGWLHVSTGVSDGAAFLLVSNSGERIPECEVPALFEPFRRREERLGSPDGLDPGPGLGAGLGLGLSIVRAVVAAHGGQIRSRSGTSGGLEVSVSLPPASSAALGPPAAAIPDPEPIPSD